ncbi:hypothetical protein [Oxalobacter paraformigenes]|uniref:hypothetical protein n=1 Tax=Oxalobacter paraformigenes TaxID=556268 RepID=UPI001C9C8F4C|nr:hypothetical protein [Oxalobacter paraformigenes]
MKDEKPEQGTDRKRASCFNLPGFSIALPKACAKVIRFYSSAFALKQIIEYPSGDDKNIQIGSC